MSIGNRATITDEIRQDAADLLAITDGDKAEAEWRKRAETLAANLREKDGGEEHALMVESYLEQLTADISEGTYGGHAEAVHNNVTAVRTNLANMVHHELVNGPSEPS